MKQANENQQRRAPARPHRLPHSITAVDCFCEELFLQARWAETGVSSSGDQVQTRAWPIIFGICALLVLAGCVAHTPYPESWVTLPPTAADCRSFEGHYGDRSPDFASTSLTRFLLLGHYSKNREWLAATRVSMSFSTHEELMVTVWDGTNRLFTRTLRSQAGDFSCEGGRLVIHRVEFVGDVIAGFSRFTYTFSLTDDYLVAEVKEHFLGVVFLVVPVAGATTSWFRFPRLRE